MQKEAYKLTGFTVVASALGFLLRWLQDMQIIEPETGLARRGAGISVLVALVILAAAAVLGLIAYRLGRYSAPLEAENALVGRTVLYRVLCAAAAVVLAVSGLVQLLEAGGSAQAGIHRLCGAGTLIGAVGAFLVMTGAEKPEKAASCRVGISLLILFGGLWLIGMYKSAAADPVIWRFAVEVLAICAALMALYYVAGYFFEEPSPRRAIFFCHLGGLLCIMSAVDEHTLGESLCYGATAVLLLAWGYVLTANLRRGGQEAEESGPEATDTPA